MDDEEAELRNPFPSPPSHYTKYTSHNLKLLALLRERAADPSTANQYEVLSDQTDVPDWPLVQLEKPRVDWILDEPDAHYDVFGDRWFVKEKIPSLAELGGNQLYPADPSADRRPALLAILRSLLVTYSSLTASLLAPPPSTTSTESPEWHRHVEWITVLSQNIMAAANDLRPVQARGNLELMMRRQLELRRSETEALHSKCDALEAKLAEMRKSMEDLSKRVPTPTVPSQVSQTAPANMRGPHIQRGEPQMTDADTARGQEDLSRESAPPSGTLTHNDVLRWAEEVG
ncbi:putative component of the Mediator complex, a coactivator involved in the regulated transcription of nearly all RNA polymerase II-dependent genes [Lyophyllum shimeji]|uniref:Mediator of RNA polymerase II transcription subunit 7 n=1 Tax=Lyophyllum shimeji TaxID=47721 RepID=A0A9P3PHM2_LYOSH|nr:putative component of the Mediator complex, a coactivator involved in the regulated transcription of nearly all RNA polymerase II-dependent genes [Lyophyllum shimeji]